MHSVSLTYHVRKEADGSPTTQNRYFVESEDGHENQRRSLRNCWGGVATAAVQGRLPLFLFVSTERNKITEVLLRWVGISELFVGVCQVRLGCWVHGANPPALLPGGRARPIFK